MYNQGTRKELPLQQNGHPSTVIWSSVRAAYVHSRGSQNAETGIHTLRTRNPKPAHTYNTITAGVLASDLANLILDNLVQCQGEITKLIIPGVWG